jgi:hypothetical protein
VGLYANALSSARIILDAPDIRSKCNFGKTVENWTRAFRLTTFWTFPSSAMRAAHRINDC